MMRGGEGEQMALVIFDRDREWVAGKGGGEGINAAHSTPNTAERRCIVVVGGEKKFFGNRRSTPLPIQHTGGEGSGG